MSDHDDYIFKFGVHRGECIADVPSDYLEWIQGNFDAEDPRNKVLFEEIEREMNRRDRSYSHFYTFDQ